MAQIRIFWFTIHCRMNFKLAVPVVPHRFRKIDTVIQTKLMNILLLRSFTYIAYLKSGGSGGTSVAQWLRCCATIRKAAGSIPDGVIGIFH